jgi:hypothetical protein
MALANAVAYYNTATITDVKSFKVQAPGACTKQTFYACYQVGTVAS